MKKPTSTGTPTSTPKRPRKPSTRPQIPILTARDLREARANGVESAALLGDVAQRIRDFCREARIDLDTQRKALEICLDEVTDDIAADSVSWSPSQRAIAPGLRNRGPGA